VDPVIWLWHVIFDGTPLCRCPYSRQYRALLKQGA
jgi:hypothetical protein